MVYKIKGEEDGNKAGEYDPPFTMAYGAQGRNQHQSRKQGAWGARNGNRYITPDVDGHNVSNGWKMADSVSNGPASFEDLISVGWKQILN